MEDAKLIVHIRKPCRIPLGDSSGRKQIEDADPDNILPRSKLWIANSALDDLKQRFVQRNDDDRLGGEERFSKAHQLASNITFIVIWIVSLAWTSRWQV